GIVAGDLGRRLRARRPGHRPRDPGGELADRAPRAAQRGAERPVERVEDAGGVLAGDRDGLRGRALPDRAAGELHLGDHVLDRLGAAGRGDEGMAQRRPMEVAAHRRHLQHRLLGVLLHGTAGHRADMICAEARPRKVPRNEPMSAISTPTGTSWRLKALATTGAEAIPPMFAVEETAIENRSVRVSLA